MQDSITEDFLCFVLPILQSSFQVRSPERPILQPSSQMRSLETVYLLKIRCQLKDENGACTRTLKVLMAISNGKWVLKLNCQSIMRQGIKYASQRLDTFACVRQNG
ncbi:uncharacterized protein [Gossypium hirsutum]|uniref:Uncharacterized protein isoform X2 n=1 Tax=Gossypium hirsutum TaxID=3635 RepID=A0ABM3C3A1_GOSHI|nr:uncharacterized protein LOC107887036 isoform X2 [Gossypium hirsutum]XP_040973770.1 uncharacterized protein LOC107887036 isoform X2 [Gossypium hirsutum]XP_040973771.1 uncharacterized protein LOC107887036 isoform X2 [Gossypium hirsutum]XP_040973772.1 uncharacterized protein LOC107887036 isoform X2 [Gossypium hirsutum]XP_040973773.1 uncharacterized protein LOC107887036 isoform X2 [Gossypium hirsutum]XP_040973774.1 uncharacterized protein LOC107887036 isoform X2 [Gossypium hirsutum]XP_04097377